MPQSISSISSVSPADPTSPETTDTQVQSKAEVASSIDSTGTQSKRNLTKPTDTKRSVTVEQQLKRIQFSDEDAKNIISFAEAFGKCLDKINTESNFHTKVKSLIAKILRFFGKATKADKLYQTEREQVLNSFQNIVQQDPKYLQKFLLDNVNNRLPAKVVL